jgi:ankyrin repeat protein
MAASSGGYLDIVKLLLDYRPTLAAKNNEGSTALSLAISNNHPDVEKLLRKHGAQ